MILVYNVDIFFQQFICAISKYYSILGAVFPVTERHKNRFPPIIREKP